MIVAARFLKFLTASLALLTALNLALVPAALAAVGCVVDIDCSDDNGCTLDRCFGGNCTFAACEDLAPVPACSMFVCDTPSPGPSSQCIAVADEADNGSACDDDDKCTIGDVCASGTCAGSEVECSGLDGECTVGRCNPSDGLCDAFPANEAGDCSDGDLCTRGETCTQGSCGGGTAPDCSSFDDDCLAGVCDPANGECVAQSANEGGGCEDGNNCNDGETCTDGTCGGGAPVDCTGLDEDCVEGQCQSDGSCAGIPIDTPECNNACNSPSDCDDGDGCTLDQCIGGQCAFAGCDQLMPVPACRMFVCDNDVPDPDNMCISVADNSRDGDVCDDYAPCTTGDQCSGGSCGGTPKTCSEFDSECTTGVCEPATGVCMSQSINDGQGCDDGQACTEDDTCDNGACAGTRVDCSGQDGDCTVGVCDVATGKCTSAPINESGQCDDNDRCTTSETCTEGICGGGSAPDCAGQDDDCNVGSCDPATGGCRAEPSNEGGSCNDGDACSTGSTCTSGSCGDGSPVDCSHLDEDCVLGECQSNGDCAGIPIDTPQCNNACTTDGDCEDDNGCTLDRCLGGQCAFASCDELMPRPQCKRFVCTSPSPGPDDECVSESDSARNGDDCDDDDSCTESDVCNDGECAGSNKDCTQHDGDCSAGRCDPATGACMKEMANEGESCSDDQRCTENEICVNGACVGTPEDCSFLSDECAVGFCDESTGDCARQAVNEGGECFAGGDCPRPGQCSSGLCICDASNCDDGNPCTLDLSDGTGKCDHVGAIHEECFDPRQSMFQLRDSNRDHQDRVFFRWKSGDPFSKPALGDPRTDTQYALCVFQTYSGVPDLAMSLVVDPSHHWHMQQNRWRYWDALMTQDGVQKIRLEPQKGHDGMVRLFARGANIPLPGPVSGSDYFNQDETIIVQLVNTDGHCWSTTFERRNTKQNRRGAYIGVLGGDSDGDSDSDSDNDSNNGQHRGKRP